MDINLLVKELNNDLALKFPNFKGIYFYGSRAKQCHLEDSDYDIIVVLESGLNFGELLDLAGIVGEIEYKYDIFIDYHPMTMAELERNPYFYDEVVNKGKYYDAA